MKKLITLMALWFVGMLSTNVLAQTSTISSATQIGIGGFEKGKTQQIISQFQIVQATSAVTLTQVVATTLGTYTASDIQANGIKLYGGTSNDISTASLLSSKTSAAAGSGETITFNALTYNLSVATHFFWITVDVSASATSNRTIIAQAIANTAITVSAGSKSGSVTLAGTCRIIDAGASFNQSNLVALVCANSSSNNTYAVLAELDKTTAAQTPTYVRNVGDVTGTNSVRVSASATSTGYLTNSNDGTQLIFTGHTGTSNAGVNANTLLTRGVISFTNNGIFNISTTYTGITGNQTRSATSINNTNYFIGDQGGLYTNGSTSPSVTTNLRSIKSFGGVAYYSVNATSNPVGTYATPTATVATPLPGAISVAVAPTDFHLVSSSCNSTYDILYLVTNGFIYKYSLVAGNWVSNGSYAASGYTGGYTMSAEWNGSGTNLYVVSGTGATAANNVVRLVDAAGYNATISLGTATILYTAPAGTTIKSIAFSPRATTLTTSVTTMSGFATAIATPSTAQTFTISGTNLSSNCVITAPTNFEVSLNGSSYFPSVTINQSGGNLVGQPVTVYVRLTGSGSGTVTGVVCCDATSIRTGITVTGSVGPNIIVTSALTAFYSQSGQHSFEQQFTVEGYYLSGNVTVTAPTNFRVSLDNITYNPSVTITQSGGILPGQPVTVYVRVHSSAAAGTVGGAGSDISISSPSATTQTINIPSSTVIAAAAGAFTPGNVVILRVGNGSGALSNSASFVFLDEYTPSGTFVQSILMNTASGSNKRITNSGSATSEGQITLSLDGSKLVVVGYDAIPGSAAVVSTSSTTTNRIVGVVNADGSLNSTTRIPDGYDQNNIRSGVTIDGTYFWTTGASGASNDGGVRYSALGASSSTQLSTAPTNARVINIFDNQIWVSASSSPNIGFSKVGNGVSNVTGQLINLQTGTPTNAYSFLLFDRDPLVNGPDLLYIADQTGGLMKFSYNGTTWTARGSLTGTASGITGRLNGSTVEIYATVGTSAGNTVRFITDATSYTTSISGTLATSGTLVATASANTVFRSVQFAPVALPGTPAVALTRIEPAAGPILQSSNDNILFGLQVTASTANAILTKMTLTTAGTYSTSDFVPNSFKLWYSSDNSFEPTDILIGTSDVPASGSTVVFNIAQKIFNATSGYFFLTADVEGSATIGNTINITSTPLSNFIFANNATKSGVVNTGGVKTIVSSVLPTTFYSNGGDLNDLANWGDQPDGSIYVAGPANFTTNNYTFIVSNGSNTISDNWTVSGINTKVRVPAFATLNLPAAYTFNGTVHVLDNGTLNIYGASIPTFGLLEENSNVNFASVSPTSQTVPGSATVSYGNLKLTGTGTKVIGGVFNTNPILVKGQFVIDNTTLDRSLTTNQVIAFEKNYTINNGVTYLTGFNTYVNIEARGTNNQIIRGNGFPVNAGRFYLNIDNAGNTTNLKPSGTVELSALTGGTNLVLSDDFKAYCGIGNTASFIDNGNTISVGGDLELDGLASNYNFTGTVSFSGASGTQNIRRSGIGAGATSIINAELNNVIIASSGVTSVQVQPTTGSSDLIIKGNFTIAGTSTGKFTPNGNVVKIGGNFNDTRTIDMIAAGTSTFEFNGTTPQTMATAYATGESFYNFTINNSNNVTITAGNFRCTSTGNMNCVSGKLFTGSNKVVLNNTATITETETSNVQGIVEITKVLTTANETFGGLGIEIQSSPAPGSTLVRRITGATVALGCANTSVKRVFEVTPTINTGLNATVKYIYLNSELGDLSEPELQLYRYLGTGPWTEITTGTLNPITNVIQATAQTSLGKYSATNPQPIGGQISPVSSVICSGTTKTLTLNNFAGLLQWQVSNDNVNWTDISGATNSTYTTPALTAKRFYRSIAYSSLCFDIASTTAVVDISTTPIVSFTNITSTSVTVTWTPFGAGQYNISWSGAGTGSATGLTTNNYVIAGLTPNADIIVTVTLATPTCVGTSPGTATTRTLCAKPTGLTLSTVGVNNNIVRANWTAVPGATSYRVYYRNMGSGAGWSFVDTTGVTKTLGNAPANTNWAVYVAVNNCPSNPNAIGDGSNVSYITIPPLSACPVPTYTAVSNCANQISVTGLSGSPTGTYRITLRRVFPTFTAGVSYNVSGTNVNFSIGAQNASSVYEVYVQSVCVGNIYSASGATQIVNVKPACEAPQNPVISNINCFGASLSWNPTTCSDVTGYYVNIKKTTATGYNAYPSNSTNSWININWLTPNTAYNVYVNSITCNGYLSPASQILTFTTGGPGCRNDEVSETQEPFVQMNATSDAVSVNLYPNPANQQFTVMASGLNESEGRVELINILGQVITTNIAPVVDGLLHTSINVDANLSSGIYLVRISSGDYLTTRQVMIAR